MTTTGPFSSLLARVLSLPKTAARSFARLEEHLLLSPKIVYFVVCAAFYALHVFRPAFIKKFLEFGDVEYGDLCAVMALVSFAFMTLWGMLADALGRHKMVLVFLCLALAGAFELFLFVVQVQNMTVRFYLSAVVLGMYSFFASGMLPLTDFLTLRKLSNMPDFSKDLYGRQRLWGTISYGLMTYLVGLVLKTFDLKALFYLVPAASAVCAVCILWLAPGDEPKPLKEAFKRKPKEEKEKLPEELNEDGLKKPRPVIQLLKNPKYMFMLFVVFMTGSARAVMTIFLSNYWLDGIKLEKTQVGTAANFGIFMEIVILFLGPSCIKIFGIYWLLIFGQIAMVVRCWAYVFLPANAELYWMVYLIELLKGVAFSFTQIAGVKLASDAAPKGLEATAQALYTSVYSQLPTVITSIIGGRCYERYGPNVLFQITAIVATVAMCLFIVKYLVDGSIRLCCFGKRRNKQQTGTGTEIEMSAP
jgi:oligosaccharide:H+ symporter